MNNGKLRKDNTRRWIVNQRFHRLGGPAYICPDGTHFWCQQDKIHRIDGPAIIFADGGVEWYINDKEITDEVKCWIEDNNISPWQQWTDGDKLIFRMKFQ